MTLGLDISTSTIGYCVLNKDAKIEQIGYLDVSKVEDLFSKVQIIKDYFTTQLKNCAIQSIYIEDVSMKFSFGRSTAYIIALLARFNGMVSSVVLDVFNVKPKFINAISSRKKAYNRSFKRDQNIKEEIFKEFNLRNPHIFWPKNKKLVNKIQVFDACDAYTISLAGIKSDNELLQ